MIVCAGNNETFDFATSIGVGLIDSAINLTRLIIEEQPDSLLFVGSAGSYGSYKPFDIIESSSSSNIELSLITGSAYTPIDNTIHHGDVSRETSIMINSSNYITSDIEVAAEYQKLGLELENMEFFSILKVAENFEIPAYGIFVVTNYCDVNAHQDFIKNHKKAKALLSEYVKEKL
ncbi:MAG TPA: purine-nucleoside phosphorylase [Campylobacterales bacterium]|nr:purine-nucleoside phosphorylase [Campylobacterales bacterium]